MPNEPRWLPTEVVIQINRREVIETGEPFGVLSEGALEMALMKPQNLWHYEGQDDMAVLATALLLGIMRNHPFQQGNKRTGLTATVVFLSLNGYVLAMPDSDLFAEAILDVITGKVPDSEFIEVMRAFIHPLGE